MLLYKYKYTHQHQGRDVGGDTDLHIQQLAILVKVMMKKERETF